MLHVGLEQAGYLPPGREVLLVGREHLVDHGACQEPQTHWQAEGGEPKEPYQGNIGRVYITNSEIVPAKDHELFCH